MRARAVLMWVLLRRTAAAALAAPCALRHACPGSPLQQQAEAAKAAELKGPHTFSLARLLTVYAHLLAGDEAQPSGAWRPASDAAGSTDDGLLGATRADVMSGVASLVAARLLTQVRWGAASTDGVCGASVLEAAPDAVLLLLSPHAPTRPHPQACDDVLEAPRYGCEAPCELVEQLALDLGVPLTSYLKYV